MSKPSTFALVTLGCKVNQYESQALRERLIALGWREAPFPGAADLYLINTCTVTAAADAKCRKEIRRAHRANPGARLVILGCAAETAPEQYRRMTGVAAVLKRSQIGAIGSWLETGATPAEGGVFDLKISAFAGHTRAFLKIQDGCDAGCAYCIVPRARGAVRSRPLDEIRAEAQRLVAAGHGEIVLAGIHIGFYGRDLGGQLRLADVVRAALEVPGLLRLRLSSIEALEISDALLDLAASDSRVCPHFHVPLQSGDDDILSAMGRRYTAAQFMRALDRIRARLELPSFTTDVMVGFPGETERQFANTLRVCEEAGFSRIHVFPFSPRPGTRAALMKPRVPPKIIRERESRLKALAEQLALEYKRQFVGRTVHPLVEHRRDPATGLLTGWTERYLKCAFEGPDDLKGRIVPVTVRCATAERFRGTIVSS